MAANVNYGALALGGGITGEDHIKGGTTITPPGLFEMASCRLIIGPMFSGKTSRLLNICKTQSVHGHKKCLVLRPDMDTRCAGDGIVFTHGNGNVSTGDWGVDTETIPSDSCSLPIGMRGKYDVVGIDEGQFFTNLSQIVRELLSANPPVCVVVAALNGTGNMDPWLPISQTIPYCTVLESTQSICYECRRWKASTTKRIEGAKEGDIGGADKYIALCVECRFPGQ